MKNIFSNLSISQKSMVIFTIILFASGILVFVIILPKFNTVMQTQKKVGMKYNIEMIFNLLKEYEDRHINGEFTLEESQKRALQRIKTMKYQEGTNYFWVNDLEPKMIMHPTNPALNGKNLDDYKDPNGKALFVEMVNVVMKNGEGSVDYQWKKANSEEISDKVSYVKLFKPWGWIVGTGLWINDIDQQIKDEIKIIYIETYIGIAVLFVIVIIVARFFGQYLKHRLNLVQSIAESINIGDFDSVDKILESNKKKL